jgi:hypothetical protein
MDSVFVSGTCEIERENGQHHDNDRHTHGQGIGKDIGKAQNQNDRRGQVATGGAGHNGKGCQNAIQTAKNNGFHESTFGLMRFFGIATRTTGSSSIG